VIYDFTVKWDPADREKPAVGISSSHSVVSYGRDVKWEQRPWTHVNMWEATCYKSYSYTMRNKTYLWVTDKVYYFWHNIGLFRTHM
jgi:hypothetical protein